MARRTRTVLLLLAALAAPSAAAAQLTINLKGARSATPVSAVVNGAKRVVGRVGSGGTVTLNAAAMNIGKGTRIDVHVHDQTGQPEVVLVPEGETDPDCRDPRRRNDADCRPAATALWGQTAAVTISLGGTPAAQTAAVQPGRPTRPFKVGATLDYNLYGNFSDVVGDQTDIQSFTGTDSPLGGGVFVEWTPLSGSGLMVGASVHYNKQSFTQTWNSADPLVPTRTTGSVDGWFFNGYGGWTIPVKHYVLHFAFGGVVAYDAAELVNDWLFGPEETVTRTNTALMGQFGAGLDIPVGESLGLRFCTNYTTSAFKSGNADDHLAFIGGITLSF